MKTVRMYECGKCGKPFRTKEECLQHENEAHRLYAKFSIQCTPGGISYGDYETSEWQCIEEENVTRRIGEKMRECSLGVEKLDDGDLVFRYCIPEEDREKGLEAFRKAIHDWIDEQLEKAFTDITKYMDAGDSLKRLFSKIRKDSDDE